jgi:hypothetical protein
MKTTVINTTEDTLRIKEGTQGVFRVIYTKLEPRKKYDIRVDPNSTYREYWCAAVDNDPYAIILSSDICQDHRSVDIYKDGGTFKWRPSGSCESPAPTMVVPTEARKKGSSAIAWLKTIFTGGDRST